MDGWPRTPLVEGPLDPGALDEVRAAIEIERRLAKRRVELRVVACTVVDEGERLVHLGVAADEPLPDGTAWSGARLVRELADPGEGLPWSGEVVGVEAATDSLYAVVEEGDRPCLGTAWVLPFDFLRAPHALVTVPRFSALLPPFARALEAARGRATGALLHPDPALGAWRGSWGILWGPPGTGKTWTLGRRVAALLDDPAERVLVLSTTNRATDAAAVEIGLGLAERGRAIGAARRVGRIAEPARFEGPLRAMLPGRDPAVHAEIASLASAVASAPSPAERARLRVGLDRLRARLPGLRTLAFDPEIRVVVTTLHAGLGLVTSDPVVELAEAGRAPFTSVVVDEAGLVGRAQVAAVALLAARRVTLVGDPRQLSPIARASRSLPRAVMEWVARSGLAHLDGSGPAPGVELLRVQRRMHPAIRAGVSALLYEDRLQDHPTVASRVWSSGRSAERLPRMLWYPIDQDEQVSAIEAASSRGARGTRVRAGTQKVLAALLERHPELREARGLFVTPFRGQAAAAGGWLRDAGARGWQASTVHAQQGAEADVVVLDTVHASSTGWSQSEWARLVNVGLSRARELCVLVATRDEVSQPWMRPLRPHLAGRVLRRVGARLEWREVETGRQARMFGAPLAAEPDPLEWASSAAPPSLSSSLGAQLAARRAMRAIPSAEQRALIERDLSDAGPRLVRGIAGSGKTLVLAHWAVRALDGLGVGTVVIVFANAALRPLLARMLDDAWRRVPTRTSAFPWDRVHLRHIRDLLADLLAERGLGPPDEAEKWDYEAQARRIFAAGPPEPRFDCVLVDETQDLGHDPLRLLLALTRPLRGPAHAAVPVLLFYDNAQNLYGRGAPRWRELGLDLRGRSDVMRESFRSTRQIAELALNVVGAIRPLEEDPDLRELLRPRQGPPLLWRQGSRWRADFCAQEGEAPTVVLFPDEAAELRAVVERVQRWIDADEVAPGDIRILVPRQRIGAAVCAALRRGLGGAVRVVLRTSRGFEGDDDAVVVTTPHSFKGYDAEVVVVCAADRFESGGVPLVSALYVALTRARTVLWVSGTRGGHPLLVAALEGEAGAAEPSPRGGPQG